MVRPALRGTKFGGGGKKSEAESEGGQKFLVDTHSPTPFLFARPTCPAEVLTQAERKLSKVSVRIFSEKSSDFVQDRQQTKFNLREGDKFCWLRGLDSNQDLTAPRAAVRPLDDPAILFFLPNEFNNG